MLRVAPNSTKVTVAFMHQGEREIVASFLSAIHEQADEQVPPGGLDPATNEGTYLLYRHRAASPMGHSIHRLGDASALAWFRRMLATTHSLVASREKAFDVIARDIGRSVYGLSSVFERAAAGSLALPTNGEQLHQLLLRDLYVECSPSQRRNYIRLSNGALRVCTDDDEVSLAYAMVSASTIEADRARWAWWMHGEPSLPNRFTDGSFAPRVECEPVRLRFDSTRGRESPMADGQTWAVLLTSYDGDSFGLPRPMVFDGVRMNTFGAYLRCLSLGSSETDELPYELHLLRAMVAPDEDRIDGALRRCAAFPVQMLGGNSRDLVSEDPAVAFANFVTKARREIRDVATRVFDGEQAPEALASRGIRVDLGEHHALLCTSDRGRYFEQWVIFDDRWAAANADLANGLLVYASHWDPLAVELT